MRKAVAYYRESTSDQLLGISAQKEIVRKFCESNSVEVIFEFEEHESGKRNDRPILSKALSESVKNGAYLIVARIDRLTRVAYFGLQLCEKYRIIFCDHPDMGTLEQSIYFGMAQQEREYISQRTRVALAALKKKGVRLGAPNATFSDEMRAKALAKRRQNIFRSDANRRAYAVVSVMPGNYSEKARYLNNNGFLTSRGGIWHGSQVRRLIEFFDGYTT